MGKPRQIILVDGSGSGAVLNINRRLNSDISRSRFREIYVEYPVPEWCRDRFINGNFEDEVLTCSRPAAVNSNSTVGFGMVTPTFIPPPRPEGRD